MEPRVPVNFVKISELFEQHEIFSCLYSRLALSASLINLRKILPLADLEIAGTNSTPPRSHLYEIVRSVI